MADARYRHCEPGELEARLELASTLLTAESDGEAVISYSLLRTQLPERDLVTLANLRDLIGILPAPPFCPPIGLEVLGFSGYESTGRSMRRLFESDHGLFGIEFSGVEQLCEGVSVLTTAGRFALHRGSESTLDETMFQVFVKHELLYTSIAEAASLLGLGIAQRAYAGVDDFPSAHAAAAAGEAFGELF